MLLKRELLKHIFAGLIVSHNQPCQSTEGT